MIDRDLKKHAREFKGYMDNHHYEVTDEGILFPRAGQVLAVGEYFLSSPGYADSIEKNLMTTQGLNHILDVALDSTTAKLNSFYLALYSGAYNPTSALTAANFAATATEITSAVEGYSEATRPAWTPAAAANGVKDNYTSRANFTIATATVLAIRGAALLSSNVKGGATGVLVSAARFAQDRLQYNTDVFTLGYRTTLVPA